MIWDLKKFKREIAALKSAGHESGLHPLSKAQVWQKISVSIGGAFPHERESFGVRKISIVRYAAAAIIGLSVVGGTALAAQSSLPGDPLFPIKRAAEQVQISLTPNDEAKAELETKFADRRIEELGKIKAKNRASAEVSASSTNIQSSSSVNSEVVIGQAERQADSEIQRALDVLKKTKSRLEDKGNSRAAAVLNTGILRLELSVKSGSDENGQNDSQQNNKGGGPDDSGNKNDRQKPTFRSDLNISTTTPVNIIKNEQGPGYKIRQEIHASSSSSSASSVINQQIYINSNSQQTITNHAEVQQDSGN